MTSTDHGCARACNKEGLYKELDLYAKCKATIDNFTNNEQDAPIGTYANMYYSREHANYYAKLEVLGPLLVSLAEDEQFYHVLVRSIIGFKNLRFDKHLLHNTECIRSFVVKLALDQYFLEIYGERWAEQKEASGGSLLSRLDVLGIFSFGTPTKNHAHNALPCDIPDADTTSTASSYLSARSIEKIKADTLAARARFSFREIIKKLASVEQRHSADIMELDRFDNDEGIVVDVVIDKNTPTDLLAKYFGREVDIHGPPHVLNKGKTTYFTDAEIDAVEIGHKESADERRKLVVEFVVTEINYFFILQGLNSDVVLPLKTAAESSKDAAFVSLMGLIFDEFTAVFEFSKRFATRVAAAVAECRGVDVPANIASKIEVLASHPMSSKYELHRHDVLERIILAFEEEFSHVGCYRNFCRNSEGNLEMFMNPENLHKMGAENLALQKRRSIKEIFRLPTQRLCRYHLILRNLMKFVPHGSEVLKGAKVQLLSLRTFLKEVNDDKTMLESIKTTLLLQNSIERCRLSLSSQKRAFVAKCDSVGNTEGTTLVMFTDMMLVLHRKGRPVEIAEIKNEKIYRLVKAMPLESVGMQNIKGDKFKLTLTEDESRDFVRIPGSTVYNEEGVISEVATLTAHSQQEKRVFLKVFSTLKNNLEFNRLGGRLFVREERAMIFFYVYEADKYSVCRRDRDMVITCTEDPAVQKLVAERDILHGELDMRGTMSVCSPKNFKCVDKRRAGRADLEADLCDILYNAVELHRSLPRVDESLMHRFRDNLETLSATLTYDNRRKLCHFLEYDMLTHVGPEIVRSTLRFIERRLVVLGERRLLLDRGRTQNEEAVPVTQFVTTNKSFFRDAFLGQARVFGGCHDVVFYDDLYSEKDDECVVSLYTRLCRKTSIEDKSLEKISIAELTSVVVLWLRHSILTFLSSQSLEKIQRGLSCGSWLSWNEVQALVYHPHRSIFADLLLHLCAVALTTNDECMFRLFSVFAPAGTSKKTAREYVTWLAKQINKS